MTELLHNPTLVEDKKLKGLINNFFDGLNKEIKEGNYDSFFRWLDETDSDTFCNLLSFEHDYPDLTESERQSIYMDLLPQDRFTK
jgi:hypothetical protein